MNRVNIVIALLAFPVLFVLATEEPDNTVNGVRSLLSSPWDGPRYEDNLHALNQRARGFGLSGHALTALLTVYERESRYLMPRGANPDLVWAQFFQSYLISDSDRLIRSVVECDPFSASLCPELNVIVVPEGDDSNELQSRHKIDAGFVAPDFNKHVIGALAARKWDAFHHVFQADFVDIQVHEYGIFKEYPSQSFWFQIVGDMRPTYVPHATGNQQWAFIGFAPQFFRENHWNPYSRVTIRKRAVVSCDPASTDIQFIHTVDLKRKFPEFLTEQAISDWIHRSYTYLSNGQPISYRDARFVVALKDKQQEPVTDCVVNVRLESNYDMHVFYDEAKQKRESQRAAVNAWEDLKVQKREREKQKEEMLRKEEEFLKQFADRRARCAEPPAGSVVDRVPFRVTMEGEQTSFNIEVTLVQAMGSGYKFEDVKDCIETKVFDAIIDARRSKQEAIDSVKWPTIKSIKSMPGLYGRELKDGEFVDVSYKRYIVIVE